MQTVDLDIKHLVQSDAPFGPAEVERLRQLLADDPANFRLLRLAVQEMEAKGPASPAAKVRIGVALYLLGRYPAACETLASADGGAVAQFYLGKACAAREQFERAIAAFTAAQKSGYNGDLCALAQADSLRLSGNPAGALALLDKLSGAVEQTAEYLYQRGATIASLGSNPPEAIALFERAVDADPQHPGALFGLALENDRYGNDDTAIDLYQRAVSHYPPHAGSLLNLGILFEDRQQYDRARQCYQRILEVFPTHARARMFFRDASASGEPVYDSDAQRQRDRLSQVLTVPVTDFELSVRARNCLQKMGILTLGDLTRVTEQELLASKNFGETSLVEIREMMVSKGLQIGMFAHERKPVEPSFDVQSMSADEQALLSRSIAELNLSVRARKCMVRLGIATVGDLIRRTGDELLECKNFGVTSLNEVREKLTSYSLRLRGD